MKGRSSPRAALAAAALALVAIAVGCDARPADSDGDGVADLADACPGTPSGRPVDARGCCAAARSLDSALDALAASDTRPMEIGEAWFLQRLAAERSDPKLRAVVADAERRLAGHPSGRILRPDAPPAPLPEQPGRGIARLATFVLAPAGSPPERAAVFIDDFTATPASGYVLTHQLLVLPWAEAAGLALPPQVAARRAGLLERVAAEQAADSIFSDLFAERAAILLAFTSPDPREADRWIDVIAAAAPADGRWVSRPSTIAYDGQTASANHPWAHTTGFVAAASGFYLQRRGAAAIK